MGGHETAGFAGRAERKRVVEAGSGVRDVTALAAVTAASDAAMRAAADAAVRASIDAATQAAVSAATEAAAHHHGAHAGGGHH